MNLTLHNREESATLEVVNDGNVHPVIEGESLADFIASYIPLSTLCEALSHMERIAPYSVDVMRDALSTKRE